MITHGDCLDVLRAMPSSRIDAIATDPPYGLQFMGKDWDKALPDPEVWAQCLRVAKPGAHMVAFGAPRLYHRLAVAIEDAGWEIRDCLMWLYGTGFPKSLDVSKAIDKAAGAEREAGPVDPSRAGRLVNQGGDYTTAAGWSAGNRRVTIDPPATDAARQWDGWGTTLKPAWEPILLARKPLAGTVAANVLAHGTGAMNIEGCRIGTTKSVPASPRGTSDRVFGKYAAQTGEESGHDPNVGRWPANLVLDEEAGEMLDELTADLRQRGNKGPSQRRASHSLAMAGAMGAAECGAGGNFGDSGGASRFFFNAGHSADLGEADSGRFHYCAKASRKERGVGNTHPTLKPIALMRWLVRLITPPGGLVLDPFMGSGSTGVACAAEGLRFEGIEMVQEYVEIARARIPSSEISLVEQILRGAMK